MKVLFKLSKDAQVTNDYSFKRYKDPLKWVLTYSERLTYYERFEMIIWRKNDGGLDMVKDGIETQHNLKLKIEEIKEGRILTTTFDNAADEAAFILTNS